MTDRVILVIGTQGNEESANAQKTLVGIVLNDAEALKMVEMDYLALCEGENLSVLTHPATAFTPINTYMGTDETKSLAENLSRIGGYSIPGYTWTFVELPVNEIITFTL